MKELVIAEVREDLMETIYDYFCDNPDKAKKFEDIYEQGKLEGLAAEEMLILFIGGELLDEQKIFISKIR